MASEAEILEECQKAIGYTFRQPELLRGALTHASGANTRLASNERMEFLGDSVLGLVVCEQLFERFPDYQEGDLTKIKSAVVSRRACTRISKHLNLGEFLFLGKGMHLHSAVPSSLLADVFESMVAAIYLDGGMAAVSPNRKWLAVGRPIDHDDKPSDRNLVLMGEALSKNHSQYKGDLYRPDPYLGRS